MATNEEKVLSILIGATLGGIIANRYSKFKDATQEQKRKNLLLGLTGGAFAGYCTALKFGTKNDTVNYYLQNKKSNLTERVYEGITYEHRVNQRMNEHLRDGKVFTEMIYDKAKPRVEAQRIEKQLIQENKPKYNKQHNH